MRKKILFFCFCFVVKIISGYSQSTCTFSTSFNATPVEPCSSVLLKNETKETTYNFPSLNATTSRDQAYSNLNLQSTLGSPLIFRIYLFGGSGRTYSIKNFLVAGNSSSGAIQSNWNLTANNFATSSGIGASLITANDQTLAGSNIVFITHNGTDGIRVTGNTTWPLNIDYTSYIQFSITPNISSAINVSSISFTERQNSSSGTIQRVLMYSVDGGITFKPVSGSGSSVTGLTYNWDYNGDGTNDLTTTATTNITHTYASAGVYNIRLISSNGSCNDTVYKSVAVGQPVVYVNQVATGANNGASWANAYTDLQTGINAAAACNAEVWVARGTYTPKAYPAGSAATTDTRYYAFYMLDSVKIFGGFVGTETIRTQRNFKNNSTILSGDIGTTGTNTDNCYHVMVNSGFPIDTVARLDGFTIKDGYSVGASSQVLTINGNDIDRRRGAGIYMHTASPHLINCIITTNSTSTSSSEGRGGGIFMQTGSPRIENSVFSNNSAGSGGGIHIREAGGTYNIVNSVFTGNTIGSSDGGGAIYLNSATLNLRNCTVYGNSSTTTNGGGIRRAGGTLNIINSIIWANTSTDASLLDKNIQNGSIGNITFSIIQGHTTGGIGNSASDPLFINSVNPIGADGQWATNDDGIKISCSSPAINAGTNTNAPKIDIIGNKRIGNPDIGAYETETFDISVNYNTQLCNAGIITPLITSPSTPTNQHFAYTAVHAPGNINLNSSTGSINLSTSDTGIYRIIFNGKISGCDVIDTTIVVIDSTQLKPTLTPNLVCAGTTPTFTAGNGSLFEFFKNGVSQGAASTTKIYTPSSLSGNDVICVRSYGPTFDGNFSASEWGQPLATSAGGPATSGFGAGNNIDAIYMRNDANYIYTAIAGNLVNNSNNRVLVFLDTKSGGFNSLSTWTNRTQAPYYSIENLNSSISFDAGFEPDYILGINQASGTVFYDLYDMQANVNTFLGEANTNPLLKFSPNTGVGDFTKGFEFAILRSALGNPTTNLKVFTMIVNDPGAGVPTYVSNQFLTRANNGESNYGNGTIPIVFSAAAPDPINYNFGDNCYTENCITVDGIPTPSAIIGNTNICKDSTTTLSNSVTGGIWIISNNTIATINSSTGTLTAINAGTTTIKYITTSNAGCKDSVSAIITVNAPTSSIVNVDTCGNSFVWKEITFNNSTNYIFDTTNIAGCDSSITLNLILRKPTSSSIDSSICQNSLPFTWNGLTFNNAGSQTATLVNAAGCDSIATLNLTLKSVSSSTTNISICATNYLWNGTNYTSSGTYTFSTTNAVGCDSIATLNLTLKSVSSSTTNISICATNYVWNGTNYTSSGTYTFNTTNAVGCDSIAILNLTLRQASSSISNVNICATNYSWNGTNYTSSGTYTFNTTNAAGCDSIATLNLTLKSASSSNTNISICATNYLWNGTNYTSSGTYTFSTTNAVGCDSIATLNLTLKSASSSTTNITACNTYTWNGIVYNTSGTYVRNGLINTVGCDSSARLILTIKKSSTANMTQAICVNQLPYTWNGIRFTTAGSRTITLVNTAGCDSVINFTLTLRPQPTIIMQDTFKTWPNVPIFLNGSISNATTVRWSPSQYLNFDTIQNPLATPPNNVEYVVTARNNNGCSTTKRIFVRMYKNIVIPNAFSPNGDGINDVWDLSSLSELPGFSVQIFNRYGNIVYQSKSFTQYWDGKRNGTNIPVGTYYYLIDIPNYKKLSGSLTILR
jgi:gliding motility-associated-like protein